MTRAEAVTPTVENKAIGVEGEVDACLADAMPDVDLLEATVVGRGDGAMLRVVVDHADGVTHELCADVTRSLGDVGLLERYGIEVWSPGPERPLRTDAHFTAALGKRVRVSYSEPNADGRRNWTGILRASDGSTITLDIDAESHVLERRAMKRANLTDENEQESG